MTEIRVREMYVAKKIYTGKSKDGEPYEIIVVQRQGARQPKIAISVGNVPSGIGVNGAFKITFIKSVMHRKWRDKKSGKWDMEYKFRKLLDQQKAEYEEKLREKEETLDWYRSEFDKGMKAQKKLKDIEGILKGTRKVI